MKPMGRMSFFLGGEGRVLFVTVDSLLMVQKSGDHHLGCMKPCKEWDFNCQPQLVQ